ncbi:glycosyltransferase [Flavihumibacter sp. R14]|nr:glycosyltransferase [Flavihumibacter soli]
MKTLNNKILYISLTNGAGGAEQILLMAAKVTNSSLLFLSRASSSALNINGTHQKITFLSNKSILWGFILLFKELGQYRKGYIIISSHSYLNAFLGFLKRIGYLESTLIARESTSVFLRFSGLKRLSYKLAYYLGYPSINLSICQTLEMKEQLLFNLPFLTDKSVIVQENPVDVHSILKKAEVAVADDIFEGKYICSAGRLIAIKGFDLLIKSFSELSGKYPDLKLLILGEGEEKERLQKLINDLDLKQKVILKGFVDNPFPYFKRAEVCVVSSIREGFPNVLLQMMALNSSVVSSLCAGGIEAFDSVRKVKVNDINGLTNAIALELELNRHKNNNQNLAALYHRTPENFIGSILDSIPA